MAARPSATAVPPIATVNLGAWPPSQSAINRHFVGCSCGKISGDMTNQLPGFFEGTGMPDPGWWEALWPDPAKVLRDVGMTPGMDVVDLCCGDGWFTFPLSRIARSVIAIEIDAALLRSSEGADCGTRRCAQLHVCQG